MELLGLENQIRQRGAEERSDLLSRPIVSHIGVRGLRHVNSPDEDGSKTREARSGYERANLARPRAAKL